MGGTVKSRWANVDSTPRTAISELEVTLEDHKQAVFELLANSEASAHAEAFIVCMEIEEMHRDIARLKLQIH